MYPRTLIMGGMQGRGDPLQSRTRAWRLEFTAAGAPWVWTGYAPTQTDAEQLARLELSRDHPEFPAGARLVACLERRI